VIDEIQMESLSPIDGYHATVCLEIATASLRALQSRRDRKNWTYIGLMGGHDVLPWIHDDEQWEQGVTP
jgi:hypothetical protein